jgi:hypothetical protein
LKGFGNHVPVLQQLAELSKPEFIITENPKIRHS